MATRATWAKRIEAWKRSELSAAEFAAQHGVRVRTLEWWHWYFRSSEARAKKAATVPLKKTEAIAPLNFVEMTTSLLAPERIEVVLRNDLRVRVPASFDDAALRRVLDVLEHR